MFQFPAFAPSYDGIWSSTSWVPPFGNLRINSCLQIPGAYRSLPRPSSLPKAKASSVRSCSLSRTCESIKSFDCIVSFCLMKLQSLNCNSKKLELKFTDYNLFKLLYLVISLSIVNELSNSLSFERGCKGILFFHTCKTFFKKFSIFFRGCIGQNEKSCTDASSVASVQLISHTVWLFCVKRDDIANYSRRLLHILKREELHLAVEIQATRENIRARKPHK